MTENRSPLARATVPRGRLGLAGDEAEQRRLAGAVAADDAPPLAPGHGEGDVAEEPGGAELDGHAGEASWVTGRSSPRQVASASPTVSCC